MCRSCVGKRVKKVGQARVAYGGGGGGAHWDFQCMNVAVLDIKSLVEHNCEG